MRTSVLSLLALLGACSQAESPPAVAAQPALQTEPTPVTDPAAPITPATSCAAASLAMDRNAVVAKVDGKPIRASELGADTADAEKKALDAYCREVQRIRTAAVERAVDEIVIGNAAAKKQTDVGGYLRDYMSTAVPEPSEEQIAKFYAENKTEQTPPIDEVRSEIVRMIKDDRAREAYGELLASLRGEAKVEMSLPDVRASAIEIPIPEHTPTTGKPDAPVTIVAFSDFECPYCAQAVPAFDAVEKKYGDSVRIAFRHFPLSFHDNARPAAEYAHCAGEQGKFWQMHDAIFEHQKALAGEGLRTLAKDVGLDLAELDGCLASERPRTAIDTDLRTGMQVGVEGTPAIYINGRPFDGAISGSAFASAIEQELAMSRPGAAAGAP